MIKIGLHIPKNAANLANIRRVVSCYGGGEIIVTGNRIQMEARNPRPLRDRRYDDAPITFTRNYDMPFPEGYMPIAIEVNGSENLVFSDHHLIEKPFYILGPEDGSIPPQILRKCHRVIAIPTVHCLNLGIAVSTILFDRHAKRLTVNLSN